MSGAGRAPGTDAGVTAPGFGDAALVTPLPPPSARARELFERLQRFMTERVLPAEPEYERYREKTGPDDHTVPPVVEQLKAEARQLGLWNLCLASESGLTQLEYAPLAELSGWSHDIAPEAMNCQAPDSGNMELLHLYGTPEQKRQWLAPLLDGAIRSAFAMTERDVASSDATTIETAFRRDGDELVIDGRKWWVSGASDPRCRLLIVMGRDDYQSDPHRRHSMALVPVDTRGVSVLRSLPVFGHQDQHGHAEVVFDAVRVPAANVLGAPGEGFAAAQARLGPGRLHHCMRALGAAERALALMIARAGSRTAFGQRLADQGVVQQQLAEARIGIEQARGLCHRAAHAFDTHGGRGSRDLVAMAKVAVPRTVLAVIDAAVQVHGGAGVSDDTPLAAMWGWHRAMRIFDGPDEVHLRSIARSQLKHAQRP